MPELKVIGSLCLIDLDELDWKLLCIERSYAKDMGIRDIEKFNQHFPGAIKEIMHWFRTIKTYDGKPENRFGFDDKVLSVEQTIEVVEENHKSY